MMFNPEIQRIGFCCKYMYEDQSLKKKLLEEIQKPLNTRGTTVAWLNRQTRDVAEERLYEIAEHNIASAKRLIEYVGTLPESLRMVRLSSDLVPVYTEDSWSYFWQDTSIRNWLDTQFSQVGQAARNLDVRISYHPGQFCVLASDRPDVVERSIAEFEYHVDMARWMGYGKEFMDMKINVHISGRRGAQGVIDVLHKLSPEARNTISIENDEMCWGLDESLKLKDHLALVLDIHHHFIRTGEYIQPTDDRYLRLVDSWRGVRPVIHYSYSREEYVGHINDELPNMDMLLEQGYKKQKLRAHSDWYPNSVANEWALSFIDTADIMCESKMKNLASTDLYKFWKGLEEPVSTILESKADAPSYA